MGYEVDFLCVGEGSGDAICIRYGDDHLGYRVTVVDGGHASTSEKLIAHIEQNYHGAGTKITHVVLSHADDDHARGLIDLLKHFKVYNLWMNRPWRFASETLPSFHQNYTLEGLIAYMREKHPYLVEMEEIAAEKGITIHDAFQGDVVGDFRILAPSRSRYISLIPDLEKTPQSYAEKKGILKVVMDAVSTAVGGVAEKWGIETLSNDPPATSASNETSIVQLGTFAEGTVLLTGDVGPEGLAEAADYAELIGQLKTPTLVQVPHHGSRRNVTPAVLDRWLGPRSESGTKRGSAICSVGSNKEDYPRKVVSNAFLRRGHPISSTRTYSAIHHQRGMKDRGWQTVETLPFAEVVEDYS
jgi:beta-lactamase superfamily II metal-dependent hydrolase